MRYAIFFNARHSLIVQVFDTLEEAIEYRKINYGGLLYADDYFIIQVW